MAYVVLEIRCIEGTYMQTKHMDAILHIRAVCWLP
jgi:hypothetical protein